MYPETLAQQMAFICEIEKLKTVYRQNMVVDQTRQENSAEHSWHIALMALLLSEHAADQRIDPLRVIKMLLVHDIVEIDAGDTFLYDEAGCADKNERETRAATRIFGLLPDAQCDELLSLWREFDARETPDALFAAALDNMQPVINHYLTDGSGIHKHHLTVSQILDKKAFIGKASPALWEYTREVIAKSEKAGFYRPE